MLTADPPAPPLDTLKPYIEALKQSQTFKKMLSRKLVKRYQTEFKKVTDSFLEDPQQPLDSLSIEKITMETVIASAKKLLIANQEVNEQFKLIAQNALFQYESEFNIKNANVEAHKAMFASVFGNLKAKIVNSVENYSSQKEDCIWSHETMFRSVESARNAKRDAITKVSMDFFDFAGIDKYKEMFEELNDAKYEHLEQAKDCAEVETERIQEADTLLTSAKKGGDVYEVLSYLKAGVPNSKRLKFYKLYGKTVLSATNPKDMLPDSSQSEELVNSYMHVFELSLNKQLARASVSHEYFVYETSLKSLFAYFMKNYEKLMYRAKPSYVGYVPAAGLESFLLISASFSIDLNDCKRYLKAVLEKIYKPLYDFDIGNANNLLNLCAIFEKAFLIESNALFMHLRGVGVHPASYAAEWISKLFVGYMNYQQVLLLVDRLLGFENLGMLAFAALGVFKYLEAELMKAGTAEEVDEALYLNGMKALKVLNLALFEENMTGEEEDLD